MTKDLFSAVPQANVLPFDGVVEDYGQILDDHQSQQYLQEFLAHLAWQADEVTIFGQHYITGRKVAWYGDQHYQYHYSGTSRQAHAWVPQLLELKQNIEELAGHAFNSCLANLYADGSQGLGWHSDDEAALYSTHQQENVIASLSLGATRKMSFKHKTRDTKVDLLLQSGQLIVMRGMTQRYWKHCIRKTTKVLEPRINLTFRYFYT